MIFFLALSDPAWVPDSMRSVIPVSGHGSTILYRSYVDKGDTLELTVEVL